MGIVESTKIPFFNLEALKKYAIKVPRAIMAIKDLMPEQGSSTIKYERAVFIILPSLIAGMPSLLISRVEILAINIFNLKLIVAIETSGRGSIKSRNKMGKTNSFRCSLPKNNKTIPIITRMRENAEVENTCHNELVAWIEMPQIKNIQPQPSGLMGILESLDRFSQMRNTLTGGTRKPWL